MKKNAYEFFLQDLYQTLSSLRVAAPTLGVFQLCLSLFVSMLLYFSQDWISLFPPRTGALPVFVLWTIVGANVLFLVVVDDVQKLYLSNFTVDHNTVVRFSQIALHYEILNRLSDSFIFIFLGYSIQDPIVGTLTAIVVVFNSYLRALRYSVGLKGRHNMGPFNRRQRLLVIAATTLFHAIASLFLYAEIQMAVITNLVRVCLFGTIATSILRTIVLYLELEVDSVTNENASVQFSYIGKNGRNLSRVLFGVSLGAGMFAVLSVETPFKFALPLAKNATEGFPMDTSRSVLLISLGLLALFLVVTLALRYVRDSAFLIDFDLKVRTWFTIVLLFTSFSLTFEKNGLFLFFGFVSYLGFKEYLSMIATRATDRRVLFYAYLAILFQYYFTYMKWESMFLIFFPVYVAIFLTSATVVTGETSGFLKAISTIQFGLFMTVYSYSHLVALLNLPLIESSPDGMFGILVYVMYMTEWNDIFHWVLNITLGRYFPNNAILPHISLKKKYVTVVPSIFLTAFLSVTLGQYLTPFSHQVLAIFGVIISVLGFCGKLVCSAVKRDLGIAETGSLLPGHGGILDRFDSLIFVSPIFFHLVRYWEDF